MTARLPPFTIASIYVPNGGKDFPAKMRFLESLEALTAHYETAGSTARSVRRPQHRAHGYGCHPKERKRDVIGQRPDERALLERIIGHGLTDVHRKVEPENADLFTWWAPWRNLRQRNIGWRLDFVLASRAIADRVVSCVVQREFGSSDHGPVIAVFDLE